MNEGSKARNLPQAIAALFLLAVGGAATSSTLHPERRPPSVATLRADVARACLGQARSRACAPSGGAAVPVLRLFDHARAELQHARDLATENHVAEARASLAQVVRDADRAEGGGRFLDQLVATRLYDAVLDLVASRPDVFEAAFVRDAFRGVTPPSGRRALEVDTIDVNRSALQTLETAPRAVRGTMSALVPWVLAEMTARREEMAPLAERGDVEGCRQAARRVLPSLLAPDVAYDAALCEAAGRFATTAHRIDLARSQAGRAVPARFR